MPRRNELRKASPVSPAHAGCEARTRSVARIGDDAAIVCGRSAWSQDAAPSTGYSTNTLAAVSASSTSDAWAVGYSEQSRGTFHPLGLHWNGTAWSVSAALATALAGQ